MNLIIAKNIKRLRSEQKLSMDELAKLCGVSKSMLAQIERGEGNPTISTLWKLCNGMKVPFDALTLRPEKTHELVKTAEVQPLLEDNGRMRNYSIFPDDENRRFAIYYIELEPGCNWESEPHMKGTVEFISVLSSKLEIWVGDHQFLVEKGDHLRIRTDVVHRYRNLGDETAIVHTVMYNP